MRYLMVVPVAARSLDDDRFAIESAFADHLRTLRELLSDEVDEIVVAGLEMDEAVYERSASHLGVLDAHRDHVRFVPLFAAGLDRKAFWTKAWPGVIRRLAREVARAGAVHSGPSHDLWYPIELTSLLLGAGLGRATISVTDIDQRDTARMLHTVGRWSWPMYWRTHHLYDRVRDLQHRAIVRTCDLVLFKGEALVADYGAGRPHVHDFADPGFESDQIVDDAFVARKLARLHDVSRPLQLAFFGRFVFYKGVHHMIDALARTGDAPLHLHLVGQGEEEDALRRQVRARGLADRVTFHDPIRYGPTFFERIREWDVSLAAPLGADTPRSAWDSLASGMPLLAYDTEFYRGLAKSTGAVELVPWNDIGQLAARMEQLAYDRSPLDSLVTHAVAAARRNTQRMWLERRVAWTRDVLDAKSRTRRRRRAERAAHLEHTPPLEQAPPHAAHVEQTPHVERAHVAHLRAS